jgi:SAM-dependent methyltransferase
MADFVAWLAALEERHLADLRVQEVTRALRALSTAYVERRRAGPDPRTRRVADTLDGAGKRAAFALFYAPLHFMVISEVVRALDAHLPAPAAVLDLGCGTGVAGAAWSDAAGGTTLVTGIDHHGWAADEARWTYRQLGIRGRASQGDITRADAALRRLEPGSAVVAAYTLNELADEGRRLVEDQLLGAAQRGVGLLVVEPIARRITPWWDTTAARVVAAGGRADEWRLDTPLPPLVERFDRAAGLNHRINACRSLYVPANRGPIRR